MEALSPAHAPPWVLDKQAQQQAVIAATEARRKEQSDIIVPLFPLLVELAQLRKQAAERLVKEFRRLCARATRGEITFPISLSMWIGSFPFRRMRQLWRRSSSLNSPSP